MNYQIELTYMIEVKNIKKGIWRQNGHRRCERRIETRAMQPDHRYQRQRENGIDEMHGRTF